MKVLMGQTHNLGRRAKKDTGDDRWTVREHYESGTITELVQDHVQWQALILVVLNLWVLLLKSLSADHSTVTESSQIIVQALRNINMYRFTKYICLPK
jgi:hypothetical protein